MSSGVSALSARHWFRNCDDLTAVSCHILRRRKLCFTTHPPCWPMHSLPVIGRYMPIGPGIINLHQLKPGTELLVYYCKHLNELWTLPLQDTSLTSPLRLDSSGAQTLRTQDTSACVPTLRHRTFRHWCRNSALYLRGWIA